MTTYDLIVVGAGSGGFAAALAAARLGISVLLVEKSNSLGGTATRGGVNSWEPGVGGTGIPLELYKRLKRIPNAVGIYKYNRHICWPAPPGEPAFPGAELTIDPTRTYADTLRRHGGGHFHESEQFIRETWAGVPFEPEVCASEMEKMLAETGHCTVLKETAFTEATHANGRLESLTLSNGQTVSARFFIDATADIWLARAVGCKTAFGQEPRSLYNEPSAPVQPNQKINGVTLLYRVSKNPADGPPEIATLPPPKENEATCWWANTFPAAVFTQYPNGDFNVNALPLMEGLQAHELGPQKAHAECLRRVRAHWQHMRRTHPDLSNLHLTWVAPGLGVREGHRLIGREVLIEHDLTAGISRQTDADIIALADHARDTHGADTGRNHCGELAEPYGIPFRSLLPEEFENLAVACRGGSFSSVAASSCRLSRTMMQLGQAAGTAAALGTASKLASYHAVPPQLLRESLKEQNVELDWPRPKELAE